MELGNAILNSAKVLFAKISNICRNSLLPKIAGGVCLSGLLAGAIFLVMFAVVSPELPPDNLVTTLNNITAHWGHDKGTHVIILPEDDWALVTAYTEAEKGSGGETPDRSVDIQYPIRPGETLSEIAYAYGLSYDYLAWYNDIANANKIRVGSIIKIPSLDNVALTQPRYNEQRAQRTRAEAAARAVRSIQIKQESRNSGSLNNPGVTVHFSIVNPPADLRSYEWDLGDGKRSFRVDPSYEYTQPKTYVVRLTAQDDSGNIYRSNPLYIDIPHPASSVEYSTTKFVTLSSPDEYFVIKGTITRVARYSDISHSPLDLSESDEFLTKVKFHKSGYYGITVREVSGKEQFYSIFVSPVPSMHADAADNNYNWYRTQFNTGTTSNCGPASVSMAIGWATGRYFPVSSVRQNIGWQGDGATSFEELIRVIRNQGITASLQPLRTVQHIKDIIDAGSVAIVLFHTDGVRTTRVDPAADLFGKYYNDSTGHYIIIKGYSLNGDYFIVHDPIPSDWSANSFRYGDEISMIGRNRYYLATEVLRSLRRSDMIVVPGL